MEKLLKNGFRTVSETELVLVDGGCPLPWCPGYDGDREGTPLPLYSRDDYSFDDNDNGSTGYSGTGWSWGIIKDGLGWQYNY